MHWVFVPHGLTPETLERWFRRAYRDVLLAGRTCSGASRARCVGEPRFLRRVATYVARRRARLAHGVARAPAPA